MAVDKDYFVDTTEPIMSIDKYNKPIVLEQDDAAVMLIIRLILLEPGTIQILPQMGVGLVSKFRYSMEPDMQTLSNTIQNQINDYLPQFTFVEVKCEFDSIDRVIKIYVTSEQLKASFSINTESGDVITSQEEPLKKFTY